MNDSFQQEIKNIEVLCIVMMISDCHIDDREIITIHKIMKEIGIDTSSEDDFFNLVIDLDNEIKTSGLKKTIINYGEKISKKSRNQCLDYLIQVMNSDGYVRDDEEFVINELKTIWNI